MGPGDVALVLRQVTCDPQGPDPDRGGLIQPVKQRGQDAAPFGAMPVGWPVPPQVTCQLRGRGRLRRIGQAEPQRGPQVLVVGVECGYPSGPAGPERLLPCCQCRVVRPVPQPERPLVAPAAQLGQPELADGVKQPVPGRALTLTEQDRLGHQRVDQVGDLPGGEPAHRADRFRGVQVERPGKDRHPPPPDSSWNRAFSRSRICPGDSDRSRTAASSTASGIPSSARHTVATAAPLPSSTAKPGSTAAPRPANNRTASYLSSSSGPFGLSSAGTVIGRTAIVTSPATPSTCRLVAMIRSSGHPRSSTSAMTAQGSARCSHPSSTSSSC